MTEQIEEEVEEPLTEILFAHNTENLKEQPATNGANSAFWNGIPIPDTSDLITEDDEPVDNLLSEKQQRLLVETLYSNASAWNKTGQPFIAAANVGIFAAIKEPPIAPDVFLSLETPPEATLDFNDTRAYFAWVFGKMPEFVLEIVSNRKGGEMAQKMRKYAQMRIPYYAVYDPFLLLRGEVFVLHILHGSKYQPHRDFWMEEIGLGLRLWEGVFEGKDLSWLRWCDERGNLIPTGKELADAANERALFAEERASTAEERASTAEERANTAEERAMRLAEQLRSLGITPET